MTLLSSSTEGAGEKQAVLTVTRRIECRVRERRASKSIYHFWAAEELSGVRGGWLTFRPEREWRS